MHGQKNIKFHEMCYLGFYVLHRPPVRYVDHHNYCYVPPVSYLLTTSQISVSKQTFCYLEECFLHFSIGMETEVGNHVMDRSSESFSLHGKQLEE